MEEQKSPALGGLWCNYVFLFLAVFTPYIQSLGALALVALIFGYRLRSRARKAELPFNAAHASWQINTLWLYVVLFGVMVVGSFIVLAWMGSNEEAKAQIDALSAASASISPLEAFQGLWAIPGIRALVILPTLIALLMAIWPFQRVLHGMLALRAGKEPLEARSGSLPALGLSLLIQIAIPCIIFMAF